MTTKRKRHEENIDIDDMPDAKRQKLSLTEQVKLPPQIIDKTAKLLVNGFIRKMEISLKLTQIPDDINSVCFMFYFLKFVYNADFDKNGILYWLGTDFGENKIWCNPSEIGYVKITTSGWYPYECHINGIIGRSFPLNGYCSSSGYNIGNWFSIDFGNNIKLQPSVYTLRHDSNSDEWNRSCFLRYWNLEGSDDGIHWITIKKHENDKSLNINNRTYSWNINTSLSFAMFRIITTGPDAFWLSNDMNLCRLSCGGFEIYGHLTQK